MFFDDWAGIGRLVVVAPLAYLALVLFLRVSGKRTLSKMNAFDLVVTVALGSTLATVLLSKSVALAEGVLALGLLVGSQYAVAWLCVRWSWARRAAKSEPTMLVHRGRLLGEALRRERVTEGEVRQALRSQGVGSLAGVEAVVLETDGSFSVVRSADRDRGASSLSGVTSPSEA